MAKFWNAKKDGDCDLDDIFDKLLLSTVNESQKPEVSEVTNTNTDSSSECESEESSNNTSEVLFRTPKAPKSYSVRPKKVEVKHPTQRPARHLVASTPHPAKTVTLHALGDISPIESEIARERNAITAQRYSSFKKRVKHPSESPVNSVTSYNETSTYGPDLYPSFDHVSTRPKTKVQSKPPETVDLVSKSTAPPSSAIYDIPLPKTTIETTPCTDFPDPKATQFLDFSKTQTDPKAKSIVAKSIENLSRSKPRLTQTSSVVPEDVFTPVSAAAVPDVGLMVLSSISKRRSTETSPFAGFLPLAHPPRSEPGLLQTSSVVPEDDVVTPESAQTSINVPEDDIFKLESAAAVPDVGSSVRPPMLERLSETSPFPGHLQPSRQEESCHEDESTEVHELNSTLMTPVAGKKYRYSLAVSDYVPYRPSEGGLVRKVPQKPGRRSCFALHGLLPGADDVTRKKRQTIMVRTLLPSLLGNDNEEGEELGSPEDRVMSHCDSSEIQSFSVFVTQQMGKNVTKVGEGVYGEVFAMKVGRNQRVVKVIPIGGDELCNGEPQKKFLEVLSEITISKALSDLGAKTGGENWTENFAKVTNVRVVQGEYPDVLLRCWDEFDTREGSQNWRPEFPLDQRYLILGLAHAGEPLETFKLKKEAEALSVFLQVAYTLAVAEIHWQFEHRDLHVGNILLKRTQKKKVSFLLNGESIEVPCYGCLATIIDFTLSRAQIGSHLVFCDLEEEHTLFQGHGDFQFEIYRLMREHNKNDWRAFCPSSNVFWLQYLGKKLLKKLETVSSVEPSTLPRYVDSVLAACSAANFVIDRLPALKIAQNESLS